MTIYSRAALLHGVCDSVFVRVRVLYEGITTVVVSCTVLEATTSRSSAISLKTTKTSLVFFRLSERFIADTAAMIFETAENEPETLAANETFRELENVFKERFQTVFKRFAVGNSRLHPRLHACLGYSTS